MNDLINKLCKRILEILKEIEVINKEEIGLEEDLVGNHLIDSIKYIELIVKLEEEYEFEFADEDLLVENFKTIKAIAEKVEAYLSAAAK